MSACSSCGTENPAGQRFCGSCGTALAAVCSSCGASNPPGQSFCGDCGSALTAAAPPRRGEHPTAERRLVSVLFADLVGFTALSESRDTEDVRELLSRYFDTCRRLIGLYGGTVEKFIGDAVMAVWGTPTATEDDAERAVRAALDLVAAVSALGQEVGAEGLRARAGVLTGEAAVTLGAEAEGMVAGDLVNTASRVQSVAEPGTVYVGESTRRATEQTIVYEEAGAFELKGKVGLTTLWKAMRVVSGLRGSLKSQGLEAPFVGRDRELRQIKDLFHTCADERKAHLVSVTGIGGIGKSRLAWEFYKYFDGIADTVYWHRGRCLAYGEGVTYWALADMVRMRCRITEEEEPARALEKLETTLAEHILDPDERRFVEPRLAQLLGLGTLEGADRQDLFAAWRLFFERLADVYPTVLAFEDLQWADASMLDFVEHLLEWSRNHPIFVVTLARPELLDRRPTWGAGLRDFTSLFLAPLSGRAMEELLGGLVPGLPDELRAQILERAEGVPLYAVETVRMLLDRGLLVRDGAVYRPAGEISSLEVPETLHALVAARLDGLPSEERRLLNDAAVLGKTFTTQALVALTGMSREEVDSMLALLVRKEVLWLQADPRSPEHGQYGFLQDLVRRVAYETLSRRERRSRHLAVAAYLESVSGEDDVAEVIAAHLVEAFDAAPDADDAHEIRSRARGALVRAGERAAAVAAASEGQRYFTQAAELTDDPVARAELVDRAGQMAWSAGRTGDARKLFESAHAALEATGEVHAAARVSARLAEVDFAEGHPPEAVARLELALRALSAGTEDADLAVVTAQLGRFLVFSGRDEEAAPQLERALALAEALELPETLAQALSSKSVLMLKADRLLEARVLVTGALELALEHNLHAAALRAYNNLAAALAAADRGADGYAVSQRALDLCRRVGDRNWEGNFVAGNVGWLCWVGRWDESLERLAEAEELASHAFALGTALFAVTVYCERGELELARNLFARLATVGESEEGQTAAGYLLTEARLLRAEGRLAEAQAAAERGLAIGRELGATSGLFKGGVAEVLECALARGDMDRVLELLASLEPLPPGQRTPYLRAVEARFRAHASAAGGDESADAQWAAAEELFRELDMPFPGAVAALEHSEWLRERGRDEQAEQRLGEAQEIFERLRARPWLERAAAVARTGGSRVPA